MVKGKRTKQLVYVPEFISREKLEVKRGLCNTVDNSGGGCVIRIICIVILVPQ